MDQAVYVVTDNIAAAGGASECALAGRGEAAGRQTEEWSAAKRWNPFNSYKLVAHVERWKHIRRGRPLPPPALVTVDPANVCNFNCVWCNAEYIRQHRNASLSEKTLLDLADFLPVWGRGRFSGHFGVGAICVAGGGEPLLNKATAAFVDKVVAGGIDVGMVTNGSLIYDCMDALSQCTWIGVSVDAGSAAVFNSLKGFGRDSGMFDKVINNMALLTDYARSRHARLGLPHPAYGVSYKFLLHKDNIGEIFAAARLAKEIGCKNIHFRPAGTPWDKMGTDDEIVFSRDDIALFQEQIALARELDCENFSVYGVTHKFSGQFEKSNDFCACHALFMTAVIAPPSGQDKDAFTLGLCCDRRGDAKLELLADSADVREIESAWGGPKHWRMHDSINIAAECPRCTYQPHNQIYEQVILNDSMTYKFI
ncbi:MAG: radical SAM protein [Deltaproteobacteria bacterium]|jgi:MoaA/NifB/PqqE/SkfB family radical SAM enzyme|nr:radical SAM protein [Deltaproteobacteria bacterium]